MMGGNSVEYVLHFIRRAQDLLFFMVTVCTHTEFSNVFSVIMKQIYMLE